MVNLPPLYKYLDVQGAMLTLSNRTFKHSKPSYFNDVDDLTIKSIFPESDDDAVDVMNGGLADIIMRNLYTKPTIENEVQRAKVVQMQAAYRANPNAAAIVKKAMKEHPLLSIEIMKSRNAAFVKEINDFMQGYRVLCVSTAIDSRKMWDRYAQNGEGVAIRIVPNVEKDSKFQLFKPVEYLPFRPSLFESANSFLESGIFGNPKRIRDRALESITYSKTLEWKYENEYRLVIPVLGEEDWSLLPYHPEEIAELYIGYNPSRENEENLVRLATALNPEIRIFHTSLHEGETISITSFAGAATRESHSAKNPERNTLFRLGR